MISRCIRQAHRQARLQASVAQTRWISACPSLLQRGVTRRDRRSGPQSKSIDDQVSRDLNNLGSPASARRPVTPDGLPMLYARPQAQAEPVPENGETVQSELNVSGREQFLSLGVHPQIVDSLMANFAVEAPTVCQRDIITGILAHKDMIIDDGTGSGKTLGIVLAILSKKYQLDLFRSGVLRRSPSGPGSTRGSSDQQHIAALIVVPNRDLAFQIYNWSRTLCAHVPDAEWNKTMQCVIPGVDMADQIKLLQSTGFPKILVGTANRLYQLTQEPSIQFDWTHLQTMVLDEVDELVRPPKRREFRASHNIRKTHPLASELLIEGILKIRRQDEALDVKMFQSRTVVDSAGRVELAPSIRKKRLQLVAVSASTNSEMRTELVKERMWMMNPIRLPLDPNPSTKVVGPETLRHHAVVIDSHGTPHDLDMDRLYQDPADDNNDSPAPRDRDVPATMPTMDALEALASICHAQKIEKAFLFVSPQAKVQVITSFLNSLGMDAQPLSNQADYLDSVRYLPSTVTSREDGNPAPLNVAATQVVAEASPADVELASGEPQTTETTPPTTVASQAETSIDTPSPVRKPTLAPSSARTPTTATLQRRRRQTRIIVATEFEARGVDIPDATHIFIMTVPRNTSSYLQMAGRAARFGRRGSATTILPEHAMASGMRPIYRFLRSSITPVLNVPRTQ
ncbi:P-loop containing nucleoside triphosphate hydrolase protein [Polychytrium aggregatum]|uniref:P-loop containing nucleoside triphosphate hydrolase protein n=1 Tax=Polychytrium aggregatum TaxID=110093 RepID=UPI0022FDBB77|nr:P-loop containing nucleoside triphosphate hydrolase protein [Polychytrium aggregatum]KAI9205178.1 P-loop containing nucleoside triphosphate hydrolase protein [Polychytrium aggregatum]